MEGDKERVLPEFYQMLGTRTGTECGVGVCSLSASCRPALVADAELCRGGAEGRAEGPRVVRGQCKSLSAVGVAPMLIYLCQKIKYK